MWIFVNETKLITLDYLKCQRHKTVSLKMATFLITGALDLLQVHCFDLIDVFCSFLAATA